MEDNEGSSRTTGRKGRMAPRLIAMAVLMVSAIHPAQADLIPDTPTPGYSVGTDTVLDMANTVTYTCVRSDDDNGMGGTHVSCKYKCPKNAEITIFVDASDKDAVAYGGTTCADSSAPCQNPGSTPECAGVGDQLTTYA